MPRPMGALGGLIWCLFKPIVVKSMSKIFLRMKWLSSACRKDRKSSPEAISQAFVH